MKADPPEIVLIEDTREQAGYGVLFSSPCIREGLPVGDYSVAGLTDRIAVERKSLQDLVASLTHERKRFEKELARARSYHFFGVVVEASLEDILQHRYRSEASPTAIFESVAAFTVRHCPFFFAGSRETSARLTESLLTKFAREHCKAVEEMTKAARRMKTA